MFVFRAGAERLRPFRFFSAEGTPTPYVFCKDVIRWELRRDLAKDMIPRDLAGIPQDGEAEAMFIYNDTSTSQ